MSDVAEPARRPRGHPVMLQTWRCLLFLHWAADPRDVAVRLPAGLELDTFAGRAWLGVIPFTIAGIRHPRLLALPGLHAMHELNVRTYVRFEDTPGVWFFSLDASSALLVRAARRFYHLPYFDATMDLRQTGPRIDYRSRRTHRGAPAARFQAAWTPGESLAPSSPGSLEHFLTERYCLYTAHGHDLYRAQIHHPRWPLRAVELAALDSSLLEAHAIPFEPGEPIAQAIDELTVEIWALHRIGKITNEQRWRTGVPRQEAG